MNIAIEVIRLSTWQRHARGWMSLALLISDLTAILLAGTLAVAARLFMGQGWQLGLFTQILPVAGVLLFFYTLRGLYPAIGIGPVSELRFLTTTTSTVILSLAGLTFFARNPEDYSRLTLGLTGLFSMVSVPLGRAFIRAMGARLNAWGEPVVVIGYGEQGHKLAKYLGHNRKAGLRPVVALDSFGETDGRDSQLPVFPVNETLLKQKVLFSSMGVKTAIMVLAEVPEALVDAVINDGCGGFRRLILLPDLESINGMGVALFELNGLMGLEVRQNLLNKFAQIQKRAIDLFGAAVGLILLSPFFAFLAVLIKLDTSGPVFYIQKRIGKGGKDFDMVKFRTMHKDAHIVLDQFLTNNHDLWEEWNKYQKLKDDPRITLLGNILRKYSVDELPQLWNVLKGEMSLVGPRPFLPEQQEMYGKAYKQYIRVLPGITGLWQVTERNESEFTRRGHWDEYYVRNWSIWLDTYILVRTVWVVLRREGAY